MREDDACVRVAFSSEPHPERPTEPVHYTGTTVIDAFGRSHTVQEWAYVIGDGVVSLQRRLNTFAMLSPALVLSMPKGIRFRDVPLGAPKSWTWDALPWEADRWARAWVAAHPGGATLDEVGKALGVTRERVRQVEESGMRKFEREARRCGVAMRDLLEVLREVRERRAEVAL